MPIFRKSVSDGGRLSESHRKVLQRCRFRLIKDIDVINIIDFMSSDEGFRLDRDGILSFPTREEKNAAFLDKLETRGDKAFHIFLEALHEKYKHLAYIVEECIRSVDDLDASDHEGHSSVKGESIRRMLFKSQKKKLEQSTYSESVDDLDNFSYEKDSSDYIDCYSVPLLGKLRHESWIKEIKSPIECSDNNEESYMGKLSKTTVFKEVSYNDIPNEVRKPPNHCSIYVTEENENILESRCWEINNNNKLTSRHSFQSSRSSNHRHAKDPLPPKPKRTLPPPVPPKSISLKNENGLKKDDDVPTPSPSTVHATSPVSPIESEPSFSPNDSKEDVESPTTSVTTPLSPTIPTTTESSSTSTATPLSSTTPVTTPLSPAPDPPVFPLPDPSQDEAYAGHSSSSEPNAPPIPPRISSASSTSNKKEQPPPPSESTSESEDECDETLMSKQIPAPDETEEESSSQTVITSVQKDQDEDYEAIGTSDTFFTKRNSKETDDMDSGIVRVSQVSTELIDGEFVKNASRSLTPASIDKLSSTDSDADTGIETNKKRARLPPKPPGALTNQKTWPDLPVLANDDCSSDGDSYYEDIDALDAVRLASARGSNAYLHPRLSITRSLDRRRGSLSSGQQTSTLRSTAGNYIEISKDELLLVETASVVKEKAMLRLPLDSPTESDIPTLDNNSHRSSAPSTAPIPEIEESSPPSVAKTIAALEASGITPQGPLCFRPSKKELISKSTQYYYETPHILLGVYQDTLLCYNKLGQAFYVKKSNLQNLRDPEGEVWYYPVPISSQHVTLFLRDANSVGCFLVYKPIKSTPQCPYNLAVCLGKGDVIHYHILQNSHNDLMIEGHARSFMTIQELIDYFKHNKSRLATRLRRPLKELTMPITPGYHYDISFELKRKDISLSSNIIGRGNFGVVCSGSYQNNVSVAVKVLQNGDDSKHEEDDFVEEAKMMMGLQHDHVIRLIGVSCSAKPFFLVTEYVPNGSLRKCLHNSVIPNDHIDILFDICLQATSAMCYLESKHFLLHRDIAARNFLVTMDMCIKLSDFGRARFVKDDYYQAEKRETIAIKWASPEVLLQSSYSTKSDVWALGVLFWEILSGGELPYGDLSGEQTVMYVIEGGRLPKPPGCSKDLYKVMRHCWKDQAKDRPSFAALHETLKSKSSIYYSAQSIPVPVKPAQKSASFKRNKTPLSPSRMKKIRHKSDSLSNKIVRRSTMSEQRQPSEVESMAKSREFLPTSSSDTSLTSSALLEKDDLTRGDKIRKSLRKMMSMKPKSKSSTPKGSHNGNTPEVTYQDAYS